MATAKQVTTDSVKQDIAATVSVLQGLGRVLPAQLGAEVETIVGFAQAALDNAAVLQLLTDAINAQSK